MRSMQEEGLRLTREAGRILRRDARGALAEGDFNLAVRRAQEAVELALKGALKILGVDYPKVHDIAPVFCRQLRQKRGVEESEVLQRIEEVSLWLAQARTPSFYFERDYTSEDAEQAAEDAEFVLREVGRLLNLGENSQ
jgi:HEPN domain-containing protein